MCVVYLYIIMYRSLLLCFSYTGNSPRAMTKQASDSALKSSSGLASKKKDGKRTHTVVADSSGSLTAPLRLQSYILHGLYSLYVYITYVLFVLYVLCVS